MFKKWTSLEEWWKFNKVTYCYMKSYGNWYEFAFANLGIPSFCIPKYWKIERQIKYVDTLIKLYKE